MTTSSYAPFQRPITPGTIGDLIAHHRARFAGWTMEDPPAPPKPSDPAPEPPNFDSITSQEEFDRRISARINREREKFGDYDELKRKAAEHDKAVEAAKTQAQKDIDSARAEGEKIGRTATNQLLLNSEARALAAAAGFRNPAIAVSSIKLGDVKVSDSGEVDADAIKAKLDALAQSEPYMLGGTPPPITPPRPDPSQGGGPPPKPGDAGRLAAQRMGFLKPDPK